MSYFEYLNGEKIFKKEQCLKHLKETKLLNCGIEYLINIQNPNYRGQWCKNSRRDICFMSALAFTVEYFINNVCSSYTCLINNFKFKGLDHGNIME